MAGALKYKDVELLTDAEVAKLLKVSVSKIRKLWRDGLMPSPILIDRAARWLRQDIVVLINLLAQERDVRLSSSSKLGSIGETDSLPPELECVRKELCRELSTSGVYFLLQDKLVIYVGSSLQPNRRLQEHRSGSSSTSAKMFDEVLILPTCIEKLLETEKTFIALLKPPLNFKSNPLGPLLRGRLLG